MSRLRFLNNISKLLKDKGRNISQSNCDDDHVKLVFQLYVFMIFKICMSKSNPKHLDLAASLTGLKIVGVFRKYFVRRRVSEVISDDFPD